jgi:hypothetical protein
LDNTVVTTAYGKARGALKKGYTVGKAYLTAVRNVSGTPENPKGGQA